MSTSAYDIERFCRYTWQNPAFADIVATRTYDFPGRDGNPSYPGGRGNDNELLYMAGWWPNLQVGWSTMIGDLHRRTTRCRPDLGHQTGGMRREALAAAEPSRCPSQCGARGRRQVVDLGDTRTDADMTSRRRPGPPPTGLPDAG